MTTPRKPQILIVDDYPTNIKVLSDFLIDSGFEVLIARDGNNALKKLQRVTPDLILLDVLMPGIDGFETCRRLKEQDSTKAIPVIFMTALTDSIDKIKGLTLGAVDYITKPFQQEEVLARINLHLKLQHLTQQLQTQNAQLQAEARSRKLAEAALRTSEEKFSSAFRSSPGLMLILTLAEGRILDINQNFCRSLGYPPETVLNRPLHELPICPHPDQLTTFWESLRNHQAVHNQECELYTETGEIRSFLMSAEVVQVQAAPCILVMAFDITECKRYAIELEAAKAAAELANQAKSQFLASISHELRTPLNTILGYVQLMDRQATLTLEQQDYLSSISRSSEHLLTLINDVLEMAKIESGQQTLNSTVFDLNALLESLYTMLEPRVHTKELQLVFEKLPEVPQYVRTDETKLRQVLINLIGNGIKFTTRGQVRLRVSQAPNLLAPEQPTVSQETVSLIFEVKDTGPGIAESEIATLFDPFVQTETGRRTQEGTGLGLPISQRFTQMMGGQITVHSQVGVGSVFQVELPVTLVNISTVPISQPRQRVVGLAPGQSPPRILVVEDQRANRLLLVKMLSLVGFEVQVAETGEAAITQCQQWQPHLICMDVRMAGIDGYEATQQIKQLYVDRPQFCPKIIAVTANAFEEERQTALAAGCDGFIRKPIQESVLFETLAVHLDIHYQYQQLSTSGELQTTPTSPHEGNKSTFLIKTDILDALWTIAEGDTHFLADYLNEHLAQIPQLLRALQAAITQDNATELRLAAHTLKGMGSTFGYDRLVTLCFTIEQSANAGISSVSPKQLQQLEADLMALMTAIRTIHP